MALLAFPWVAGIVLLVGLGCAQAVKVDLPLVELKVYYIETTNPCLIFAFNNIAFDDGQCGVSDM